MRRDSSTEKNLVFGANSRSRVDAVVKTAAMANGASDQRIYTHSLRAGGATALYTQGVPIDVTQRGGRWESLTPHQYTRRDAESLNRLAEVVAKSHGLSDRLRLLNKNSNQLSLQQTPSTMGESMPETSAETQSMPTDLFSPMWIFAQVADSHSEWRLRE